MSRVRSRGDLAGDARARALACVRDFPPSIVQASAANDCDINVLVKRFGIGAEAVPPMAADPRYYGDFDLGLTLQGALDRIVDASEKFARLPVELRNRFDNSPAQLWRFVMDPRNAEAAVEMGLLARRSPVEPRSPVGPPSGNPPPPKAAEAPSGA